MISGKRVVDKIIESNFHLFDSFSPKYNYNFNLKRIKNLKNFRTVIIIGMGGSILGAKAIYSFLKHKIKKKFIFIDNLDQEFLREIKNTTKLSKSLFLIVSKSGNTNETIINSSFFKPYLKKTNTIIISEGRNNILSNFAKREELSFIKHNPFIGGRYSVFSEPGMLPAYLMGLRPKNFKKKLPDFLKKKKTLSSLIQKLSKLNIKKTKVLVLFNYVPELNDFMFWCQQLMAESLGKNKKGFIPVISNAPKDHHSLLQLYLDGPKDKIFYVFSSKNKNYQNIKLSQKNAFIESLKKNKTPFREIIINKFDEETIGKLFLLFILETIALAQMMNVNPYDQPAVENVKILTKKFLNSEKSSKKNF